MFSSFTSQILTSPFTPPSPVISEVLSGRQRSFHFYPLFFSALGEEKSCISGAVAQHPAAAISRTASEWLYRRTTRALDVREWRQIFSIQRDRFGVMDDGRKVYVRVYLRKVGRNGPGDSPSFIDLCEPLWLFFDTQLGNSLDEFRGDIKKTSGQNGPGGSPSCIDLCELAWLFFDTQLGNSVDEFRGDIEKNSGQNEPCWHFGVNQ